MTLSQSNVRRGSIITVTSGKGGVGKTNVVINLAVSLARLGHRVGVLDADFGLGNIDVMLGLTPLFHLGHVLTGDKTLDDIVIEGPMGIRIIPAGTGVRALTALTPPQWELLRDIVHRLSEDLDFLLIDSAAGISDNVIELLTLAERVVVVTSFEPTAVVDAYAVIKILNSRSPLKEVGVVINAAHDSDEAGLVFRQLDMASSRFLARSLRYYGFVVQDPAVREAVLMQRPIVDHSPQSPASRCFRILASRLAGLPPGGGPGLRILRRPVATSGSESAGEAPPCA